MISSASCGVPGSLEYAFKRPNASAPVPGSGLGVRQLLPGPVQVAADQFSPCMQSLPGNSSTESNLDVGAERR